MKIYMSCLRAKIFFNVINDKQKYHLTVISHTVGGIYFLYNIILRQETDCYKAYDRSPSWREARYASLARRCFRRSLRVLRRNP